MSNDIPTKKRTKRARFLNKTLKFIVLTLLIIILAGSSIAIGTAFAWIKSAKPLNVDEIFNLNLTTYIVDKNDKVIDKLHADENRTVVSLDNIPKDLQNAFIAIEDKRFYKHNGIDIYRIFGAIKQDIIEGRPAAGGSTITQQLVKNVYLNPEKLLKRKIIEIYYALQLERQFTKHQILEAYLNTADFSRNISGVKEAALYYFGKDVSELTLAECAMLAGITNNPSLYSPYNNFENADKRKKLILSEMLKQGYISEEQYKEALNQTIVLKRVEKEVDTTYFSDMVIKDVTQALQDKLGYTKEEAERKVFNGGLKIIATIDTNIQNILEEQFSNPQLFPKSKLDANGVIQPEASMIIIDNSTGEIKAVMGGRSQKVRRGLNRATQSLRQPGSAIKPLAVYAPALDNGYTTSTVIDDVPVTFGNYSPKNYDRKYRGLVTVRQAIQSSLNTIAVKIVQDIGIARSYEYLERFGISTLTKNDQNLAALSLGGMTKGVKPLEIAAAYSVFPNKGVYLKPISFTKVLDSQGNVIIENNPVKKKVISEQVSYLMVDIMKGVVRGGTGGNAALSKIPVAGKTGTTSDNIDAWFVGYSPYYTASVWMGYDEPQPMNFTGGSYPAKLWKAVMERVHASLPYKDFDKPSGIITVDICTKSGKRPTSLCALHPDGSAVRSDFFIAGTEPSEQNTCDVHVTRDIDIETGQLASPNCPPSLIQSKVFIQRPVPFVPSGSGTVPADYIFEAPTNICEKHGNLNSGNNPNTPSENNDDGVPNPDQDTNNDNTNTN